MRIFNSITKCLAVFFLVGLVSAQRLPPDQGKIQRGAKVISRQVSHKIPQKSPVDYPATLKILDEKGVESKQLKWVSAPGDTMKLTFVIENLGIEENFFLGGATLGLWAKMPGVVHIPPYTSKSIEVKLLKLDCEYSLAKLEAVLRTINDTINYRPLCSRLILKCP